MAIDLGLLPVLGWELTALKINQPSIALSSPHHLDFLKDNKIKHRSQFWISDEEDMILVTLDISNDPPKATIHWLTMKPVVVKVQ